MKILSEEMPDELYEKCKTSFFTLKDGYEFMKCIINGTPINNDEIYNQGYSDALEHARKIANLPTDGMTNEEILKTMWPDVDIVKFEDNTDIEFANCWFSDSKYLIQVDKNWLKEKYTFSKEE